MIYDDTIAKKLADSYEVPNRTRESVPEPLVSVRTSAYNHGAYIEKCIEGVLSQKTSFGFEYIIGEDFSTDGTREKVFDYARRYPERIRLLTAGYNVGMKANGLRCIDACRGKYMAICEGDDYWSDPTKLQRQVDFMESHPDFSMCFHNASTVDVHGRKTGEQRRYDHDCEVPIEDIIHGGGLFCPTASILFRKEFLSTYPDVCERCHVGDYPLQLWLAVCGRIYYIDRDMAAYRQGDASSWTQRFASQSFEARTAKWLTEFEMLDAIDAMTEHRHADAIRRRQSRYLRQIMRINTEHEKELRRLFAPYFRRQSPLEKLKMGHICLRGRLESMFGKPVK